MMTTRGRYQSEKRYMDTWSKWMALLGLAILGGGGCALGWELLNIAIDGLVAGYVGR